MNCENCGRPVDPAVTKYWRELAKGRIWFCNCICGTEWYEMMGRPNEG